MGLIREPKHVDFYFDDRPLTDEEKRLLKEAIAKNKAAERARKTRSARTRPKKSKAKATR
jgi:hypothetical protein